MVEKIKKITSATHAIGDYQRTTLGGQIQMRWRARGPGVGQPWFNVYFII